MCSVARHLVVRTFKNDGSRCLSSSTATEFSNFFAGEFSDIIHTFILFMMASLCFAKLVLFNNRCTHVHGLIMYTCPVFLCNI